MYNPGPTESSVLITMVWILRMWGISQLNGSHSLYFKYFKYTYVPQGGTSCRWPHAEAIIVIIMTALFITKDHEWSSSKLYG